MSRRARAPWRYPGDSSDPYGFAALVAGFVEWMRTHGYSERTVENRQRNIADLASWLEERGITRPSEVTRAML